MESTGRIGGRQQEKLELKGVAVFAKAIDASQRDIENHKMTEIDI